MERVTPVDQLEWSEMQSKSPTANRISLFQPQKSMPLNPHKMRRMQRMQTQDETARPIIPLAEKMK